MSILVTGGAGYIGSHKCIEPVSYTHLDVYKRQVFIHHPHQLERLAGGP